MEYTNSASVSIFEPTQIEKNRFLSKTYFWMALALFISAVTAYVSATTPALLNFILGSGGRARGFPTGLIFLCIIELALVFFLSTRIRTMSVTSAISVFLIYALVNGMTLSFVFLFFSISSIAYCFVAASAMFFIMAIFGAVTKRNLSSWGYYLTMALIGVIIVSFLQFIIFRITKTPLVMFDLLINFAVIVIFAGLTAYDNQKIMKAAEHADSSDAYRKLAVYGALQLYLDFINIFLRLLRIFGRSKN
ncbi:MAG: Bax inhibitor-1/YccA family protein [Treponemataceae bacterium]